MRTCWGAKIYALPACAFEPYAPALFTLEKAKKLLRTYRTPRTYSAAERKVRFRERKTVIRCRKCMRAGLVRKVTHHATEDCIDRLRKQNVEKLANLKSRKRGRERSATSPSSKVAAKQARKTLTKKGTKSEEECKDCKAVGRPYRYAPK